MNPAVDFYFVKAKQWREELAQLRMILIGCGLSEELKWGVPCYTHQKRNIVLIHVFKEYCAILFFKGALMQDKLGILVQQTENVQGPRQIRFTGVGEILDLEPTVQDYVQEAIAVEDSGLKVELKKTSEFPIAEEFQARLDENPDLKMAFEALTPGRQRGYCLYFSSAKQAKTRAARVEKHVQHILDGKGLDD